MNRTQLPTTRKSVTPRGKIGDWKIYFSIGLYANGQPGELFVNDIEGPQIGAGLKGLANQWAIAVSMLLQDGATVEELERKFSHARYEPNGPTDSATIHFADSITDYVIRIMVQQFGEKA